MSYNVLLTNDAAKDLDEIIDYIHLYDSAKYVLKQIKKVIDSLSRYPERGSYPDELIDLGIKQYREVYFKTNRLVYQVMERAVYIMLVADGRRDTQTLLSRRLLAV